MADKQKEYVLGPITPFELGWLVGLWEGEGHFGYDRTQLAHLRTTDEDIAYRNKELIERVLNLSKPIRMLISLSGRINEQELLGIQTYGATARGIMKLVVPHMGFRRRQQIWRSLNQYRPVKHEIDVSALLR
jgi:hypothetical protein